MSRAGELDWGMAHPLYRTERLRGSGHRPPEPSPGYVTDEQKGFNKETQSSEQGFPVSVLTRLSLSSSSEPQALQPLSSVPESLISLLRCTHGPPPLPGAVGSELTVMTEICVWAVGETHPGSRGGGDESSGAPLPICSCTVSQGPPVLSSEAGQCGGSLWGHCWE